MTAAAAGSRSLLLDARIWIALAITAATLWLAFRGVDLQILARDVRRADVLLLVGLSIPLYLAQFGVRALRWRHLTDAVAPIGHGPLFRASLVGFMANNVFPLRIGEFVRAWFLARQVKVSTAAVFGTIVLERVLDAVVIVGLGLVLLGSGSASGGGTLRVGLPLVLSAVLPLGGVVLLRVAPDATLGILERAAAIVLPRRFVTPLSAVLRRMAEGLGSLQGGRHLFWVAWHSLLLWLVLGPLPFVVGFLALGIDLGSMLHTLRAAYVTLVAVAVAVAVPSAPGFFGPYHLACREALARFGVGEELALALGTLVHAAFWVIVTVLGLLALRGRALGWRDLRRVAADAERPSASR